MLVLLVIMEVHVVTMDGHLNAIVLWALSASGVKLKVRLLSIYTHHLVK